ncbi:unnamed protein product [Ceratitis capitata]|uniref:(Mediterranean fruit fly) hypothetical protein n=1 Tax=Ceratitis capitata TaxID=7213 RepID=A0A811V2F8_CERCA|nr:unnamed protein product [Ceratitis capitata]
MLAIKECLIREGVLNLTSTSSANHGNGNGNGTTLAVAGGENQPGVGGGDYAAIAAADAGVAAKTGSLYHNNKYNDFNVVSNNLRAISANYTVNNDSNRYRSYYDRLAAATTTAKPPLALGSQLAKFGEQNICWMILQTKGSEKSYLLAN